ncbi:hypothetical protein F5Y11DRAFT_347899 [Daldinia sp. FL1419]|nr:hypothetical protein F5Y11DRAFT_347899 [Daldinia sp. FL1419]
METSETLNRYAAVPLVTDIVGSIMESNQVSSITSQASPSCFTIFSSLPAELRQMIWEFSLPHDSERTYLPDITDYKATTFPMLWIEFPVIMWVCQEARYIAKLFTRFQYWEDARCEIPYRPFRPETDVWILRHSTPSSFKLLEHLHNVAFEFYAAPKFLDLLPRLKNMRTLYIVEIFKLEARKRRSMCLLIQYRRNPIISHGIIWENKIRHKEKEIGEFIRDTLDVGDGFEAAFWDSENKALKLNIEIGHFSYYKYFSNMRELHFHA